MFGICIAEVVAIVMLSRFMCSEHTTTSMKSFVLPILFTTYVLPAKAFLLPGISPLPFATPTELRSTAASDPETFLRLLDNDSELNNASSERTRMLTLLIENKMVVDATSFPLGKPAGKKVSILNPGRLESMMKVATGTWQVIYAPHMKLGEALFGGGNLDVQYILYSDGTIESHAKVFNFPWMLGLKSIYLSVSGTYGSVSDNVCEIAWDNAWVRHVSKSDEDQCYAKFSDVPDNLTKAVITNVGKFLFIRPFSVFPISFLSENLIVFDFEVLRTRICARKIS